MSSHHGSLSIGQAARQPAQTRDISAAKVKTDSLRFGKLPAWIVTDGMIERWPGAVVKVYNAIAIHCNGSTLEGWPGIETLVRLTGLGERTVQRSIERIVKDGAVETPKGRQGGRGQATVYRLVAVPKTPPPVTPLPEANPVAARQEPRQGATQTPPPRPPQQKEQKKQIEQTQTEQIQDKIISPLGAEKRAETMPRRKYPPSAEWKLHNYAAVTAIFDSVGIVLSGAAKQQILRRYDLDADRVQRELDAIRADPRVRSPGAVLLKKVGLPGTHDRLENIGSILEETLRQFGVARKAPPAAEKEVAQ